MLVKMGYLSARSAPVVVVAALLLVGCGLDLEGQLGAQSDAGDARVGLPGPDASLNDAALRHDGATGADGHQADVQAKDVHVGDAPVHDTSPPPFYPSDCAEADAGTGTTTVTLYVGGDSAKPWSAICLGGNTYLQVSASRNVSSYPSGSCATVPASAPSAVKTTWSMIRVDPSTFIVDTADYTGASSTGTTHEVSGGDSYVHDYTEMPYASTRSCDDTNPTMATGTVDLTGTNFAVASSQAWPIQGYSNTGGPFGGGVLGSTNATVSLSVGGYPAGISPCNDYYTTNGGSCLQLVYAP
jgi:hypothetical protein